MPHSPNSGISRESLLKKIAGDLRSEERRGPGSDLGRCVAKLSAKALRNNYQVIADQVPGQALIPMVKANAYGHGLVWAGQMLQEMPGLYALGVATLSEGVELREGLGARGRRTKIMVFSGALPWSDDAGQICESNGLTPVISSDEDWHSFFRGGWPERLPYHLEFNTGMNRLGMSAGMARSVVKSLKDKPSEWHPEGIASHFAMSESFDSKLTRAQIECFNQIRSDTAEAFPGAQFHLANSGAIWNAKNMGLTASGTATDIVRPGISLYGVPPWASAPVRGLLPVMTLSAKVYTVRKLMPGESIGYGATFTVSGNDPVWAAILGAGYADGVHRRLSNKGHAWCSGRAERFLGIVSMDLSAVTCTQATKAGESVEILGPNVDIWGQAKAAETIPYELLTSVSPRVQRIYE